MKRLILLSIGLTLLMGCAPVTFSRDQIVNNISVVLKLEHRITDIRMSASVLKRFGQLNRELIDELKLHHDVYFMYYTAANVHLAHGEIEAYKAYVKKAEKELDSMEKIIKKAAIVPSEKQKQKSKTDAIFPLYNGTSFPLL